MARSPPPPPPSPAQGNGNGSGSGSLTARDALAYIKAVKDNFQDKRHMYEQFLQVMRDFKSNRLDSAGVIARVKTLFHGYPDLVLGISAFLPKGHAIRPQDLSEDKEPVDYPRAINLVNRIKVCCLSLPPYCLNHASFLLITLPIPLSLRYDSSRRNMSTSHSWESSVCTAWITSPFKMFTTRYQYHAFSPHVLFVL
jgi:histone deacetylase complex regulatory component SIN3